MLEINTCNRQKYNAWRPQQAVELKPPQIDTEAIDGVQLGRIIFPVAKFAIWVSDETVTGFINCLSGSDKSAKRRRRNVSFSMSNNTVNEDPGVNHDRAVSSYFTYNPIDETIVIEWGKINPNNQEAKLHTYLNRVIDHRERVKQGMKVSSGHMAKVCREGKGEHYLAFFDRLIGESKSLTKDCDLGKVINTLYAYGFIPITSDGYVQLPAFL